ncbi:RHOMBOID-like protein 4, partial [Bienertia sinuspersici]
MGALVMDKIVHENQGWSLISCIVSYPCAGQHVRFISYWKEYKWGENLECVSGLFGRSNIFVGASVADFRFYPVASLLMLALIVVVNLGVGILPHVENFAHKGGLLQAFPWFCVSGSTSIWMALTMLFNGMDGNDHCSWYHYLSCVPTSKWSCGTEPRSCS